MLGSAAREVPCLRARAIRRDQGAAITAGLRASRVLHGHADRYIAISRTVADGSRQALPDDSKIVVIPTTVPNQLRTLAESTPRPACPPPRTVISCSLALWAGTRAWTCC